MSNTYPPNEVSDGKAPGHGNLDTPNPNANEKQFRYGPQQQHHEEKRNAKANKPAQWGAARQDNRTDLVSDCHERVPRFDDRRLLKSNLLVNTHVSISGFGLLIFARYVVRGRVFNSARIP